MVNLSSLRYSFDRFKQIKYRKSDSWFGVFLSVVVAPAFIGILTWQIYIEESRMPYTIATETFATTSVFDNDAWPLLKCESPSGCFYKQQYSDRGITSRCGNTAAEAYAGRKLFRSVDLEKWRFVRYGQTFQLFGCVSPSVLDGLFIAHVRKPFHSKCAVYGNANERATCAQTFFNSAKAEGWMPCDTQYPSSDGERRQLLLLTRKQRNNLDNTLNQLQTDNLLTQKEIDLIKLKDDNALVELLKNMQDKNDKEKADLIKADISGTRKPILTKKPTASPTLSMQTNSPTAGKLRFETKRGSQTRNGLVNDNTVDPALVSIIDTGRIDNFWAGGNVPSISLPSSYQQTQCFNSEKMWPLFYSYNGDAKNLQPMIDESSKRCLDTDTCDFTQAYYPYAITLAMPAIMDADAIFNRASNKDNPLVSNENFCEAVREFRRANSKDVNASESIAAYSAIPVHYGSSLVSYQKLVFEGYECKLTVEEMEKLNRNKEALLFESPSPTSKENVNYVQGYQPSSIDDNGIPPPPNQDNYYFKKSIPDMDGLINCMQGTAKGGERCQNNGVYAQLFPTASEQPNTLRNLYNKDRRRNIWTINSTVWDDPQFLEQLYIHDHLAITKLRFVPTYQKTTVMKKDYVVLLIVALGGYLSLVLVGGRMLAMMYNAIMEKCCGKEMYPEEAEIKRFRESRMSAGGADAKSIEMSNPMHPIH